MKPVARVSSMLIEDLDGEFVIYDQAHDLAHTLNRTASIVWRNCDGTRTVSEVAAVLQSEGIAAADDDLVRLSIDHLAAAGLMEATESRGPAETRLARRQLLERVGVVGTGSLVLPAVETLTAPRAVAATSDDGSSCSICSDCSC